MTLVDDPSARADAELEVLARLTSLPQMFGRNGNTIINTGYGDDLEEQVLAASLMAQIYTSPLESQPDLATQLMQEHSEVAKHMWYEAAYTCHAQVLKAFDASRQIATQNAGSDYFNDVVNKYQKSQRQSVFDASPDDKITTLQRVLDEMPDQSSEVLFDSCVKGDLDVLNYLLEHKVEIYPESRPWLSPLHAACFNGNLACAQALVNAGIDVNRPDEFSGTPLMRAAVGGKDDVLVWLLENGAHPTLRETRKGTYSALEYGAGKLSVENLRKLLDRGCEVTGDAIGAAASFGNEQNFDLLFESGGYTHAHEASGEDGTIAPSTARDEERNELLQTLRRSGSGGSIHIIDSLLNYMVSQGLDRSTSSSGPLSDFQTAIQDAALIAIAGDKTLAADHLLTYVLSTLQMDIPERVLTILLTEAAESASVTGVKLLIETYNASVNSMAEPHFTSPLYHAVRAGDTTMIRLLIEEYGADIHQSAGKFANGPTALWLAVDQQREDVVRELLRLGGPIESRDAAVTSESKRMYLAIAKRYRAPVRLLAEMDPSWDVDGCEERFLCLEYPEGFVENVVMRKPDEELKDSRELRQPE